jgi:hypothetical protein
MRVISALLLFLILLSGCRGPKYATKNLAPGSIPSDITDSRYVLLVQREKHSSPSLLNKSMKKYYPGAYEIVTEEQLKSDHKFNDLEKYRYLVIERYGSGGQVRTVGQSYSSATYSDQVVLDRKENKQYPGTNLMSHNQAQGLMLFSYAASGK